MNLHGCCKKIKHRGQSTHVKIRHEDVDYFKKLLGKHIEDETILGSYRDGEFYETVDYLKIKEAYKKAHDIRKFEIDLYWKRANHFWLFMTALAGLSGLCIISSEPWINYASPAMVTIGFIFGLAFHCANKWSKYLQENWEKNVDKLEFYVSGNLYKLYHVSNKPQYSVSRINLHVSFIVCFLWFVSFFFSITFVANKIQDIYYAFSYDMAFILISSILSILSWTQMTAITSPACREKADFKMR